VKWFERDWKNECVHIYLSPIFAGSHTHAPHADTQDQLRWLLAIWYPVYVCDACCCACVYWRAYYNQTSVCFVHAVTNRKDLNNVMPTGLLWMMWRQSECVWCSDVLRTHRVSMKGTIYENPMMEGKQLLWSSQISSMVEGKPWLKGSHDDSLANLCSVWYM